MDPSPSPTTQDAYRNQFISLSTLVLGACIVAFLTRYNLQGYTVWSAGEYRPRRTWDEYLIVNATGLAFLPLLLLFGALREEAAAFGLRRPERDAVRIAALLFLAMLPVLFGASRLREFQNYYPIQSQAAYAWGFFLYYELTYGFYLFCWEFFYRGFLTFGLARGFGFPAAIGLQSFAFGIMHWGKPIPEFYASFVAGIALGWLAVRGRSFLPCFALHWAIAFTFDVLVIQARPGGIF